MSKVNCLPFNKSSHLDQVTVGSCDTYNKHELKIASLTLKPF